MPFNHLQVQIQIYPLSWNSISSLFYRGFAREPLAKLAVTVIPGLLPNFPLKVWSASVEQAVDSRVFGLGLGCEAALASANNLITFS